MQFQLLTATLLASAATAIPASTTTTMSLLMSTEAATSTVSTAVASPTGSLLPNYYPTPKAPGSSKFLGVAAKFNGFFFGSYQGSSDVQG